ncbi:MAG: BolA family transcriptional regulator, partial [Cellvibrionales bacterium]|nr:BolA family transcriptional regulator [Cellvibrionales bacterium]
MPTQPPQKTKRELTRRLTAAFTPTHLTIANESHHHAGPKNAETHFKITLVAQKFANLPLVARHQAIYALLPDLLKSPIHALALHLYTPEEWQAADPTPPSPPCA